ncbi:hypothetical protein D3C87_1441840 [compost metagenome]|uniref:DUF305 domain-containing protein n=1 Tax=Cupriavidus campinensis TaxID=151783 RepID=A0AAE9L2G9_9BURK|nr:hypothetical protein [Cupriavidus campinensis]URF03990.1 hypothetical protein M5D45_16130 [Cupriavidus campinensis]
MTTKSLLAATLAVTMLGASGWSFAAEATRSPESARSGAQDKRHDMMKDHMMGSCPMMGQLPPGNEKLSMQMHAEMMQAMGDIMRKYADKIQTPPTK